MVAASARVLATAGHMPATSCHEMKRRRVATHRMAVVLGFIPYHAHVQLLPLVTTPNPLHYKVPRMWRHDSFVPHLAMKDTSEIAQLIRMPSLEKVVALARALKLPGACGTHGGCVRRSCE